MRFSQFQKSIAATLTNCDVKSQLWVGGVPVTESDEGLIYVDWIETDFSSLEEARDFLIQRKLQKDIQEEIQREMYTEMSDTKIADIIRKHHGKIRVTDTLIESYVDLASSRIFTIDPVANDIRKNNPLQQIVEGRRDFTLKDGSVVVIGEDLLDRINNVFGQHADIIDYMREGSENFLAVIQQLEE